MAMNWHDLLFAHYPVRAETLRPLIPPALEIDTFDGWAWIGIVPFRMTGVRPRYVPALECTSAFPELNVRTYVKTADRSGVWFFSLDASNRLAHDLRRLHESPPARPERRRGTTPLTPAASRRRSIGADD